VTQIFLSHSTVDTEFVDRLAADLRLAGIVVWRAPESILPGEEWVDAIQRGLGTSSHLVLVMSPAAVESGWVKFEFNVALRRYHEGCMLIIPVDYQPCDAPLFWRAFQHVGIRDKYMKGLLELVRRVVDEQPTHMPTPAPPETTVGGEVALDIGGDVRGDVHVAGGDIHITYDVYDAGRPAPPPVIEVTPEPEPAQVDVLSILPPPFEWCDIPAGEVTIEGKVYRVEAFRIGKYPVTYAQFQAFVFYNDEWWEGLAAAEDHRSRPGLQYWPMDNHPRERVSWYDAVAFCRWLSRQLGYEVRLPTEWEWQRAAQGDDGREYPWGNDFDPDRCNTRWSGIGKTTPVDRYPTGVSPYGMYDMAGNVWEWCLNKYGKPRDVGSAGSAMRVLRGGSWHDIEYSARVAIRVRNFPNLRGVYIGFRCCARS
jgi:hypothetical protein